MFVHKDPASGILITPLIGMMIYSDHWVQSGACSVEATIDNRAEHRLVSITWGPVPGGNNANVSSTKHTVIGAVGSQSSCLTTTGK